MDKSSKNDADVNAQRIAALRTVTEKLGHISVGDIGATRPTVARQVDLVGSIGAPTREASEQQQLGKLLSTTYVVTTGSSMLYQFVPWYLE